MIIHSLRARRWRGISDSGELELQPGFNLLSGPNGSGKSSLLESMLMTFFVKHTSKNAETRAIEPLTGGGSPESDIIFSFDGQKWKVHKRFLKDSVCELWRMERGEFNHVANGDEADALLRGFLQASGGGPQQVLSKHRGLAQALWSLQRDVELLPAESWCESVSVALSGTVRQVAQDPIYRAVCKLIEDTFDRHWTGTGKVKKGSSQEVEDDKLVAIRKELSELRVQRDKAEDHRETLERIEIELTPLVEHLQEARQEEEDARAAVARSEALQPQLAALQAQLREATQEVEIVEAIQLGWNKAQTNQERLVELEQRKVQAEAKFSAQVSLRVKDQIHSDENFLILPRWSEVWIIFSCKMNCFFGVHVRSKAWGDDRGEAAAGADGLEMNLDISLRGPRLGKRTVLSSLPPYHDRSVWSRGREARIMIGAEAIAFPSPFGMT